MKRMRRNLAALLALAGGVSAVSLPPISIRNGRFTDANGVERHFRGVNVVYKDAPWYPDSPHFHSNLSFTADDADLLQSFGVNLIRLGVMWPGVMPEDGVPDKAYLRRVDSIVELAASRGMYTLLDPHQDEFNPLFCGEGVPDWWARANTKVTDFPVPVQKTPFGVSPPDHKTCDEHSSFSYIWTHDGAKAYQKLWKNPVAFADFWRTVAAHFKGNTNILAGEVWNEPFPGDVFGNTSLRVNAIADRDNLQPFYENIEAAIHSEQGDPDLLVAYEPSWPVGDQDLHPKSILPATSGFSRLPGINPIYAFHYYVAPCNPDVHKYLDERLADAKRLSATPLATEFNLAASDDDSKRQMIDTFEAFEGRLISYTGWQYKSYSGSLPNGTCTGCGNSFFNNDGSLNTFMSEAIARPFVQVVAGRALNRSFDPDTGKFTFSFAPSGRQDQTTIVLPGEWSAGNFQISIDSDAFEAHTLNIDGRTIKSSVVQLAYHVLSVVQKPGSDAADIVTIKLSPKPDTFIM